MLKNKTTLQKYLIYNRISGSYNLLNWILTTTLTTLLLVQNSSAELTDLLMKISIGVFWFIALISSILFIFKSFSISKKYKNAKNIISFSVLSFFIPFIFNFLIRKRLKPFK